jgi:hypothetical protein
MFSREMKTIYRRLLILGLFSMGLFIFGVIDETENVQAATAPCFQDCEKYEEMCLDNCQDACSSNDPSCSSCISTCFMENMDCQENSIYCTTGTVTYNPECEVNYGPHCIFDASTGQENCSSSAGAHNGYFEKCNRIGYPNGCIVCTEGEHCHNFNETGNETIPHCPQ